MNTFKSIPVMPLLALTSLLALAAAPAATYYVAWTGSDADPGTQAQPFKTIQHGIAAAQSGDLVLVGNGSYSGSLDFGGKNLVVRSTGGRLLCGFAGTCWFRSGESRAAVLEGFTIGGAQASAVAIWNNSSPTIAQCLISNRLGSLSEAGGFAIGEGSPLIDHCTITQCSAQRGGGMQISQGSPTISYCTFSSNSVTPNTIELESAYGGAIDILSGANPTIDHCTFLRNGTSMVSQAGGLGGAVALSGSSATLTDCIFVSNTSPSAGGGVYVAGGNVTLTRCRFSGNKATSTTRGDGGGLVLESGANGTLVDCLFLGNQAVGAGGGIYVGYQWSTLTVLQSTFTLNSAPTGGGIRSAVLQHNLLALTNSIVFNNPGGEIFGFNSYAVAFSDVGGGFAGTGNINADPIFVNAAAGDGRLQSGSPCINAGHAGIPNLPATDLDGAPRILGGAPDMGAYESTADCWFVDATAGNDANVGSPATPFLTVARAVNVAADGQSIYIRQGSYHSDRPRITKPLHLLNWGGVGLARIGQP